MYWLRRIPAETRIVVLVVFLALFQSILLSVIGLDAIRGERRQVEEKIRDSARFFLQQYVVARCQMELSQRALAAYQAAFDRRDPAWRSAATERSDVGEGLFTDAFAVLANGRIEDPVGASLVTPRELMEGEERAARTEIETLRRAFAAGEIDEEEKGRRDLDLALRYPFVRDEFGESVGLLLAASPLYVGGSAPNSTALLRMRWVGILNRLAGLAREEEIDGFLQHVDAAGSAHAAEFLPAVREQDRQAAVLAALAREAPRFPTPRRPVLHRRYPRDASPPFYLRPVGADGDLQVLALNEPRLVAFLQRIAAESAGQARGDLEGLATRIEEGTASDFPTEPATDIEGLPGFVAVATIPSEMLRIRAGSRERVYWWIITFSILGILAGGVLTARVVRREMKLAKLKSGFVSNVSHELKTPLTSIRMFVEMLRSGKVTEDAERDECLAVIGQESDRLGRLIQQVLDFGRLEARQRRFRWTTGSVRPLVERETERFARATGLEGQHLEVRLTENPPAVTFDPEAFTEVLTNLLSNAYKYSPAKTRRIRVLLGLLRGRLALAVEDNGPGVSRRERKRIFEQFYRAGDLLTREVEGTGLGLSIARNIVRAHGGRIHVEESALGGSRFVVLLPLARDTRAAPPAAAGEARR